MQIRRQDSLLARPLSKSCGLPNYENRSPGAGMKGGRPLALGGPGGPSCPRRW